MKAVHHNAGHVSRSCRTPRAVVILSRFQSRAHTIMCLLHMQDGPVHDVQWHPSGEYFITVAGFMPAKTTLFTDACKAHYDLGSGPHNIARWSPQVRACHGQMQIAHVFVQLHRAATILEQ